MNDEDKSSFWIFRAFPAHQTATFLAVLAPTILHSGVVRLPTWCRLAGFSYVVRPFTRSRRPLTLSGYFFYTHTISVHQHVKELFFYCPFSETLVWRKIVAARTTYFIRYKDLPLRRQRGIQLLNGTKKRVWLRRDSDPSTLVLGKRCSIQLSYSVWFGAKEAKRTDIAPKCLPL